MRFAMELASSAHVAQNGEHLHEDLTPSFVEVAHEMRMHEASGAQAHCCPDL